MAREFSKAEYSGRVVWLIWGRALLLTALVGLLVVFQHRYGIYSVSSSVFIYTLATVYALSLAYGYLIRHLDNLPLFVSFQLAVDSALITFFVLLTGGGDSGLSFLYHLVIISASIMLYRRGGFLTASLASILYGAMLDMQYYEVFGLTRSQNSTPGQLLAQIFVTILSFYSVAFLSGILAERLRTTHRLLLEQKDIFADLKALQEHILRGVSSGILTLDLKGNITSWNPPAEQITGYDNNEIRAAWRTIFGESIKELFGHTDSLKQRPLRFNSQCIRKDGTKALLGMTASLLKDDSNAVRGIILTFQDITQLVEMEEQMRRQERLATIGSLAAGIAHEIRNPLASLSGSIQLLRGDLALNDDDRRLMDIVERETDRLNSIISGFLEYARPHTEFGDRIELAEIVSETVILLRNSRYVHDGIQIQTDVAPEINMRGDPARLRQVLWNLFINACQAMPRGGVLSIRTSVVRDDTLEYCELEIGDTGEGIAPEALDKIFVPFFTTKPGGTGLGLAIAYRIIEDHGGSMKVVSAVGEGTRFSIRLPMKMNEPHSSGSAGGGCIEDVMRDTITGGTVRE